MPNLAPVWMSEVIWKVLLSRMRERMEGVDIMISKAAQRPLPPLSARGNSTCEITATSDIESCVRTCSCWFVGKESMIRSTVEAAPVVCSVPKTKWPVSAAVMAAPIVSRSRISPTRITSGS